jgi:DNA polymerase III sliding clamp (beta) subunit (PCNA family)
METDEVKLTFKAPERATIILPAPPEGEEAGDYLCLIMPLRLLD